MGDASVSPPAPTANFRCGQCSATFVRQDHLHRHELSHGQLRSCVCEFCSARFHRRDILRRHYKNCKERGDRPIPSSGSTGRRRHACDRCALHKLACDPGQTCRPCASKNHRCSRTHSQGGPRQAVVDTMTVNTFGSGGQSISDPGQTMPLSASASEPSASPFPDPAPATSTVSRPLIAHNAPSGFALQPMPVPLLSALVSSDPVGFVDIFGYSSIPPEPLIEPPIPSNSHGTNSTDPSQDFFRVAERASNSPLSGQNVPFYSEISPAFGVFGQDTMPVNNKLPERNQYLTDPSTQSPESRKIYELVTQLTNAFITLPKGHHAKATSTKIDQADTFFTLSNVQIFIQTYFHHFHPHFSIIHRPSFNLKTASPRLLLAVCLAGSLYMSLSHDIGYGRSLLDLAEEFIFRDAALKRVAKGRPNSESNNDVANDSPGACESSLEILQAAFIIVVLQNWEGNNAAQRRARIDRLQQLVSMARALRLTAFKPTWLKPGDSFQSFDWADFGRQESCARIMYNLYTFDSTLCIFYNYPPKFALAEMAANLPCPEELFAATTSAECLQRASLADYQQQQSQSLKETFPLLLGDDVSADAKARLVQLTPFHLFILIHTLHYLLWHSHNTSISGPTPSPVVERAISRWKSLWDWSKRRVSARLWRRLGFIQHADEYRWLAQLKMHEGLSEEALLFEDDHMRGVRQLLGRFCAPQAVEDLEFDV